MKILTRLIICVTILWAVAARAQEGGPAPLGISEHTASLPLVVRAASTPTPTRTPTPPAGGDQAAQIVEQINAYRVANGCPALSVNAKLTQAAQLHAVDMLENDFFDHKAPDGSTPGVRVTRQGYVWGGVAENIAAGYSTASSAVSGWLGSPGHLSNIMNCDYTETGVGYVYGPDDDGEEPWGYYWVQVFARPL